MAAMEERIKELILPILNSHHVTLYHLEWVREGKDYFLRILLDNTIYPVDLDTCVKISEMLSPLLDQSNIIPSQYMLEVSSAGAERPLITPEQIRGAIGQYVYLHLKESIEGKMEWTGDLVSYEEGILQLKVKVKTRQMTVNIPEKKTDEIRLSVRF